MVYFSTKDVSSSHPPVVTDEGSRSMMCNRNLFRAASKNNSEKTDQTRSQFSKLIKTKKHKCYPSKGEKKPRGLVSSLRTATFEPLSS